jgi:hypothetical protein
MRWRFGVCGMCQAAMTLIGPVSNIAACYQCDGGLVQRWIDGDVADDD